MELPVLSEILGIDDPEILSALSSEASLDTYEKGTCLLRTGEVPSKVYFLISGITCSLLLNSSGKDVTECFVSKPGMPVMPSSRLDVPSQVSIETLTRSELVSIPTKTIGHIVTTTLEGALVYNRMLQQAWELQWNTKVALEQYKAPERYAWFKETYPEVDQRVPARYVASFLGMTPVTLSRIRSKMHRAS